MGRQAYLSKLAFGRSAFEPTQDVTQSEEYIQLGSSQAELPARYQEFNGNNYVQLYDERGNPINPRSREYGKKFRNAQNDVLAAVGVVERRQSPSDALPGSYAERLDELEFEDTIGSVLGASLTLTENLCTWWVGSIRDRVLTFRYHDAMPFARIIQLEHAVSGNSIIYTSFIPRVAATICAQTILYNAFVFQPFVRLMDITGASSKTRRIYRLSKDALKLGLRLSLEVLFYPFAYHADLQRLGLIPARPFLPHWKSLLPLSSHSPIIPFSIYYDPTTSIANFAKAVLTSPLVFVCMEHFYERWVYAAINEAVDSSILRPDNPDLVSPDAGRKHRLTTILGLRRKSSLIVRRTIHNLLSSLGWAMPLEEQTGVQAAGSQIQLDPTEAQTIEVGGTTVTNITPLDVPILQRQANPPIQIPSVDEVERPTTPTTPTIDPHFDDDDPRIRITNREGIVEMEVRLPPRILSTHTEVADALAPSQASRPSRARSGRRHSSDRPYHRVTVLSMESAQMISSIVKAQLVGLAVLPLKFIMLRLVASHFIHRNGDARSLSRVVLPLPDLGDLSWRSIGTQLSRLLLCSGLEVTIDLALWSVQHAITLSLGKNWFDWGEL
ncbi:hypothetical protein FB567DRAFT_563238 [Paraphoma chrysanthemicola]|uniref:Uncharacterized protein n=1 Tax=Paraphoma chrysanthemicola TaxID=798071 RepID=A0A8K0QZ08_9PLEO|nr:hypothetical protein FB567DRAFT_563238 [Paraphoma chrysanthemicola]